MQRKFGCIDKQGQLVIAAKFDRIYPFDNEVTNVVFQGKSRIIDKAGKFLSDNEYDLAMPASEGFFPVCFAGKWGYADKTGELKIPAIYDGAQPFSEGLAQVSSKDAIEFIDKTGRSVFRLKSGSAGNFSDGLAWVKTEPVWVFLDKKDSKYERDNIDEIYPPADKKPTKLIAALEKITSSSVGSAGASAKWGLIDNKGQFVVQANYTELPCISNERALLINEQKAALFDMNGKLLAQFESAYPKLFEVAIVKLHNKWGVVDLNGKLLISPQFDELRRLDEGLFLARVQESWQVLDSKGQQLITPTTHPREILAQKRFSRVSTGRWTIDETQGVTYSFDLPEDNLETVNNGDYWGAVDKRTGKVVFDILYDRPITFDKNGLCLNTKNECPVLLDRSGNETKNAEISLYGGGSALRSAAKYGFIDKTGAWIIKPSFDGCINFRNSLSAAKAGKKWWLISKDGKRVSKAGFDAVKPFSADGLAAFESEGLWGFINGSAKIVVPAKFDDVKDFSEGLAAVKLNGKWGFIDRAANQKIPCEYMGVSSFAGSRALVWGRAQETKSKSHMHFELIDPSNNRIAGPYTCALDSGNGLSSVTDDFINWTLLDGKGNHICTFKHYADTGGVNPAETLMLMNDRMVISLPCK